MTPKNRDYHINPRETSMLARSGPRVRLPTANLSISSELPVSSARLRCASRFWHFSERCGCRPKGSTSIRYTDLKQLGDRRLFRIDQFSRPLEPRQSFAQLIDLLIMRFDLLLYYRGLIAQPFMECI